MPNSLFKNENSKENQKGDLRQKLLKDLESQFGSLFEVRSMLVLQRDRLLNFILNESPFAKEYTQRFFHRYEIDNKSVLSFKADDFLKFLDFRVFGASYTAFSNKIGLANNDKFIIKDERVVLNFTYKDGVIKGAQSKDEDKSDEIFFNDILDKDEIDVLFSPKALCNFEFVAQNAAMKQGGGVLLNKA